MIYAAMCQSTTSSLSAYRRLTLLPVDEYDEATALAPAETLTSRLPNEWPFLALDADGEELPDDWYL